MSQFTRRAAIAAITVFALAACGTATGDDTPVTTPTDTAQEGVLLGHSKGNPEATVTVIEYASPTCPACKYWHDNVMKSVDENYVTTGKINFIYREYPLNEIDVVAYSLARCAGDDKFFEVLDDLFSSQDGIKAAARQGVVEDALKALGARHGVTDYEGCKNNIEIRRGIADTFQTGEKYNVTGTPTFVVNEKVYHFSGPARTPEGFAAILDEQLASTGQ